MRRAGLAFSLCVVLSLAASARAEDPAGADVPSTSVTLDEIQGDPGLLRSGFDLLVLRPFGLVQLAVGAVLAVPAYPVALLVGGEDDVVRACIRDPVARTFLRPLGRL